MPPSQPGATHASEPSRLPGSLGFVLTTAAPRGPGKLITSSEHCVTLCPLLIDEIGSFAVPSNSIFLKNEKQSLHFRYKTMYVSNRELEM